MKCILQTLLVILFLNVLCLPNFAQIESGNLEQETLKVGVYLDLSGPTISFGQATADGILLATEEFNQTSSKRIELVVEDSQGRPEQAKAVVTKLINQDRVHAILGEVASSNSLAAAPVAQDAKIPMITPAATNEKVTQVGDYIFRACFADPAQGEAMARFAFQNLKARRAAVMGDVNSDYSKDLIATFAKTFKKLGGKIVILQSYTQVDSDFKPQLAAIRRIKPDVIYVPGYYGQAGIIVKQARQLRMNMPILGGDGWDSTELFKLGENALRNTYITNHFSIDSPSAKVKVFAAKYEARFKTKTDALAALGYDAMKLLIDAWQRAESGRGEKLRNALAVTKEFAGVTGKIKFDNTRNAIKPVVILRTDAQKNSFRYFETIYPQ